MNHFVVSARKYRPSTFDEVVGQKAVTNTLKNAIAHNHLAQALLFTGPRGVGKTSCARILAKTINQSTDQEDSDFAFNIFELDAASNNSVEDIRNLNDQVRIPPQAGKFKVYIIDEVHMLSQSAFNAFLKTLEEPPKHAIFILATTEKHKIIPTILSRCQIFDFKRITVQDIKDHLKEITQKEGVEAEEDALQIIAQKSDGAMRDALSTYDRVVSYCGNHLTRSAVAENLNILDFETFLHTTDLILNSDIPELLVYFNSILAKGFDGQHFISGLASHFRDLLVCKNASTISLLDVGEKTKSVYKAQSDKLNSKLLVQFIDLSNACDFNYKLSQNKRLHVELCLMKLASHSDKTPEKKKTDFIKAPNQKSNSEKKVEKITKKESHDEVKKQSTNQLDTIEKVDKVEEPKNELTKSDTSNTIEKDSEKSIHQELVKPESNKKNGLSLKSLKYKKDHVNKIHQNQKPDEVMEENFTLEDITSCWIKFAEIVDKKGEKLLASTILSDIPKLEGHTIKVNMPNDTMKFEIMQNKGRILSFVRNTLKNSHIDLAIHVNLTEEKKYVHTSEEKYERFKELNPKVELLKQKLDLDF